MTKQRTRSAGTFDSKGSTREQCSRKRDRTQIRRGDNPLVGLPQMHHEHLELLAQETELSAAVDVGAPAAEICRRLTQLLESVQRHFDSEEELMRSNSFPELKQHSDEHRRLIRQMSGVRDEVGSGAMSRCGALALFVRCWVEQHMASSDARFVYFLHEEKNRRRPNLISLAQ